VINKNLSRAILVVGAVILINYDGIIDILHKSMLEKNVPSKSSAWSSPGLNPQSIFSSCKNVTVFTVTFCTPASCSSLPKLPMLQRIHNSSTKYYDIKKNAINKSSCMFFIFYLMPWPGPQATFSIHKLVVPGPTDTQSSSVPILAFKIVTSLDD